MKRSLGASLFTFFLFIVAQLCLFSSNAWAGHWEVLRIERTANYRSEYLVVGETTNPQGGRLNICKNYPATFHSRQTPQGEKVTVHQLGITYDDPYAYRQWSNGNGMQLTRSAYNPGINDSPNWYTTISAEGSKQGQATGKVTFTPILHWKRDQINYRNANGDTELDDQGHLKQMDDPNDNPPQFCCILEHATVSGVADAALNTNPFAFTNVTYPFGTDFTFTGQGSDGTGGQTWSYEGSASRTKVYATHGLDTFPCASRTFSGNVECPNSPYPFWSGDAYIQFGYSVTTTSVNVSAHFADVQHGTEIHKQPDFLEINAFVKQNYTLGENDEPLQPFWDGSGTYWVQATQADNGPAVFDPQKYLWQTTQDGTPIIQEADKNDPDAQAKYMPDDDFQDRDTKEFHLNLGADSASFPKTSSVWVKVSDGQEGSDLLPAHVIIHWYLPHWYVTIPAPVTTVTGANDPDNTINPDTNPDNNEFVDMQTIAMKIQADKDFFANARTYIGGALEVEKEVATFYTTAGVYEAGAAGAEALLGKAGELLAEAAEVRQEAAKATEIAAEARKLAEEGKLAGKSYEDITKLEEEATTADQLASDATEDATRFEQEGNKATEDANAAKAGCFVAGTPILMADGTLKPIEKLNVGDSVLSRDPKTGIVASKKVLGTTVRHRIPTLVLVFSDGQSIETTANHPFFVASSKAGQPPLIVLAGRLVIGSSIITRAGPNVSLTRIGSTKQRKTVYNCTIDGFHTYYVGQSHLLVHNGPCFDFIPRGTSIGRDVDIYPRDPVTGAKGPRITDLDNIEQSGGTTWVLEEKSVTDTQAPGMDAPQSPEDWAADQVTGKLDKIWDALHSGSPDLPAALQDPTGLVNGTIKIGFDFTGGEPEPELLTAIENALDAWQKAHGVEVGLRY